MGLAIAQVQSPESPGSAPVGNPLLVAGQDGAPGNVRTLLVDSSGRSLTKLTDGTYVAGVDSVGALYVAGKSAVGFAPSSNPVSISGVDGSGLKRILLTDSAGRLQATAAIVPDNTMRLINLTYRQVDGAINAGQFKRILTYTIPVGYNGYLARFTTWQAEPAYSRLALETKTGTLNVVTNVFTAGSSYVAPQFSSANEVEVTTQFGAANNVVVTVTYTNENGVAGRTGTLTVPKSSIVGTRFNIALQAGDLGIRSVQSMSASPSGGAGALQALSFIHLSWHNDLSTTQQVETVFAPATISLLEGVVIAVEYAGGTVAKERIIGVLIQLAVK